jgi:hypothetical protein
MRGTAQDAAHWWEKATKKNKGASKAERAWEMRYDQELKQTIQQAKQIPVLINYSLGKKRFEKEPDVIDMGLIQKIENSEITHLVPNNKLPLGFNTQQPKISHGLTRAHHFYTRRNLLVLAKIYSAKQEFSSKIHHKRFEYQCIKTV